MVVFFEIVGSPCNRTQTFNLTTRNIIAGNVLILMNVINLIMHSFLLAIILIGWKSLFRKEFVYRLIVNLSVMGCMTSLFHFVLTIPCTFTGCLVYPDWVLNSLTGLWRSMEYGFLLTDFIIAVDRFFTFYLQRYSILCRNVSGLFFLSLYFLYLSLLTTRG